MLSLWPIAHLAHRLGVGATPIEQAAEKSWEIAPAETAVPPRAFFLDGQLERVTGWAFASGHPRRQMEGSQPVEHGATRGFLLKDAVLLDGALFKGNARTHMHPRTSRLPRVRVEREIDRAAVYCTPGGSKYFGQWLMDDCVTYPLAAAEGVPVTTAQPETQHGPDYERRLEMSPQRCAGALLREAVIFADVGQNRSKHARFRAMGARLAARVEASPFPGVFILRGTTGEKRVLANELELADHLRQKRGFRVIDPVQHSVEEIVASCAGARVVAGIEGSGLMHAIPLLPAGGAVLTLQPPNRFVGVYKHLTDRDGQHFGFVVGTPQGNAFRIDAGEVERTLDLFPPPPG
jgi:hypothetical protein